MYPLIQVTKTIANRRGLVPQSPLQCTLPLVAALALAWFALMPAPTACGVTPAPDGGYPGGNTAEGDGALQSLTNGSINTATGYQALFSNTTGGGNTANGYAALFSNTSGGSNTAMGAVSLFSNIDGIDNTAIGDEALYSNTSGNYNTGAGINALFNNTNGSENTANGFAALGLNMTGNRNTGSGSTALFQSSTGSGNTANGYAALCSNRTGSNNTALGYLSGQNLTSGSNNIDIGANVLGRAGEANTIRIGTKGTQKSTFIAGIAGTAVSGSEVLVSATGKLGVATSSARFKQAIKPMDKASEAILALKPVTFHYMEDIDPDGIPQFGLIAEEVEKVNPNLVGRDENGRVNTVRYEAVNAMLLNEFLKEHRNVAEQQSTIAQLKTTVAQQQKQIEALTATRQKVSDQR